MKNIFLKGVVFSLGFCLTIGAFILTYAAWTNLGDVDKNTSLTDTLWNQMIGNINQLKTTTDNLSTTVNGLTGNNIPTGLISAFNGTSCPDGWNAADGSGDEKNTSGVNTNLDLRGQFLRGLNNFGSPAGTRNDGKQDPDSRILGSYQNQGILGANVIDTQTWRYNYWTTAYTTSLIGDDVHTGNKKTLTEFYSIDTNETRPKNTAVIFCVKN